MHDDTVDYSVQYRNWHTDDPMHVERMVRYMRDQLRPLLAQVPRGHALDIGCGMGFTVLALRELGFSAEGLEADSAQFAVCEKFGAPATLGSDIEGFLSTRTEVYSVVVMQDLLEHLPRSRQLPALRSVRSALCPGGLVALQVPNAASPVASYWLYDDYTHEASFTVHSLEFLLFNAGFSRVDVQQGWQPGKRPALRLWRPDSRSHLRRWLVHKAWRQVMRVELGDTPYVMDHPIDVNLVAVARP